MVNRVGKEYNDFCIIVDEPVIGKDTWIGYFTLLDGSGKLNIGEHCSIASGVHIYTHDTVRWATLNLEKGQGTIKSDVKIGNNCFIGANSTILRGVQIGNNCIVGAGSVVLQYTHIKDGEVWAGVPAKRVK